MNNILKYSAFKLSSVVFLFLLIVGVSSCKKMIEVQAPFTSTNASNVYTDDATAAAVLTGIYTNISKANFSTGGLISMSLFPALSADELTLFNLSNTTYFNFYKNSLTSLNTGSADFWNIIYPTIFTANSAIEGLTKSNTLTPSVKEQLLGEAKFIRAFCYFYLVNLYGDVPLAVTTDYEINKTLPRTPKSQVYQQIITDLIDAQNLLSINYLSGDIKTITTERTSPTKWAATALLSRTYLFASDSIKAETEASAVINNSSKYDTVSLNNVFLKNSKEAIWQLQPVGTGTQANTGEGRLFLLPAAGPNNSSYPVYLSNSVVNSFEPGDNRKVKWTGTITVGANTYYYPWKYKIGLVNTAVTEYSMVLRLAEQYLIRAEARARQNNISGAQADLNIIRTRAGLSNTTANDRTSLLAAIMQERKVELFTEWGHRWFDLKRTNSIDAVMNVIAPNKGATWNSNWALYPIPQYELDKNPSLVGHQNPGY